MSKQEAAYAKITAQIVSMLEDGVVPWRKPWDAAGSVPTSLSTGKAYRGINQMILGMQSMMANYGSPYWGTYRQIAAQGGQVKKGERSTSVILWKPFERENADGETVKAFFMTTFAIFNAEQADWPNGMPTPNTEDRNHDPIAEAEALAAAYFANGPSLSHGGDRAYYSPSADAVRVPEMGTFYSAGGYYSTLFHEMIHSTGHASRLDRDGVTEGHFFGSEDYSKEELVAEMGAAFLCAATGIAPDETLANSASYIASWLRALKNDSQMIVQAASKAQRAADYAQGIGQAEKEEKAA